MELSDCKAADGHPDVLYPAGSPFGSYANHVKGEPYIAAEINGAQLRSPHKFIFGDNTYTMDNMYHNGPLNESSCYLFFMRVFPEVGQVSKAFCNILMLKQF